MKFKSKAKNKKKKDTFSDYLWRREVDLNAQKNSGGSIKYIPPSRKFLYSKKFDQHLLELNPFKTYFNQNYNIEFVREIEIKNIIFQEKYILYGSQEITNDIIIDKRINRSITKVKQIFKYKSGEAEKVLYNCFFY
jgi:hypothetical protein